MAYKEVNQLFMTVRARWKNLSDQLAKRRDDDLIDKKEKALGKALDKFADDALANIKKRSKTVAGNLKASNKAASKSNALQSDFNTEKNLKDEKVIDNYAKYWREARVRLGADAEDMEDYAAKGMLSKSCFKEDDAMFRDLDVNLKKKFVKTATHWKAEKPKIEAMEQQLVLNHTFTESNIVRCREAREALEARAKKWHQGLHKICKQMTQTARSDAVRGSPQTIGELLQATKDWQSDPDTEREQSQQARRESSLKENVALITRWRRELSTWPALCSKYDSVLAKRSNYPMSKNRKLAVDVLVSDTKKHRKAGNLALKDLPDALKKAAPIMRTLD